jgi:hypothetical protein
MIPRHNNLLIQSENYKTWKKENNKKEIGNILLKHVYIPVFNLAQKGGGQNPYPHLLHMDPCTVAGYMKYGRDTCIY